jgi:hypothetical protein
MPDPSTRPQAGKPARKPRRFWLWAPYALVLAALIAWSGVWWTLKLKIESDINEHAKALRAQGDQVSWSAMTVGGWPFRLTLTLTQPKIADPAGWGLAAPILKGEAMAYSAGHWVVVADQGLTLTRPGKGPLAVSGRAIRASASGLGSAQPRLSFEGLDLILSPAPGGQPAALSFAKRLELHLQPGPSDQGALLVRIEDAKLAPFANLARISPNLDLTWDARLSHLSAFKGATWPAMVQAWTAAGGAMSVADAKIALGGLELQGSGGTFTVGPDGRLRGSTPLGVGKGGGLSLGGLHFGGLKIGGLSFSGSMPLTFEDGRAAFGAFPIGAALKVY